MQIEEIKELVKELIEEENILKFEINQEIFQNELGREEFNKTIRIKVEKKLGVYIWVNSENNNIVYIGMAGKLKNNGKFVKEPCIHDIKNFEFFTYTIKITRPM